MTTYTLLVFIAALVLTHYLHVRIYLKWLKVESQGSVDHAPAESLLFMVACVIGTLSYTVYVGWSSSWIIAAIGAAVLSGLLSPFTAVLFVPFNPEDEEGTI